MKFDIHESVKQCTDHCKLGYVVIRNAKVHGSSPSLAQKIFQLQTALAEIYNIDGLTKMTRLAGVRNLYNHNKFDATRYTPGDEVLVRRILENKDAYYVNSAVATINYCSLKFILPADVYDFDQIQGDIKYGLPLEDSYTNMNGENLPTHSQLFLSDNRGVLGNATARTRRTAVTLSSKNLLAVIYGNETVTTDELMYILGFTGRRLTRYNGGTVEEQDIIEA